MPGRKVLHAIVYSYATHKHHCWMRSTSKAAASSPFHWAAAIGTTPSAATPRGSAARDTRAPADLPAKMTRRERTALALPRASANNVASLTRWVIHSRSKQ